MISLFNTIRALLFGIRLPNWRTINILKLQDNSDGTDCFTTVDDDPQWVLRKGLLRGWYVIEFSIDCGREELAKLYYDIGNGFTEEDRIVVPYVNGSIRKRFFYLPRNCRKIRFDPTEANATFRLSHFKIRRVFKRFAVQRIQAKLRGNSAGRKYAKPLEAYARLFERGRVVDYESYLDQVEPGLISPARAPVDIQISVLMSVYNPPPSLLREAIESVRAQSYPHWQLCIADDRSTDSDVTALLRQYQQLDDRIIIHFRTENGHISRAGNTALSLCTGEFVALMDHDDVLPAYALNEVAHEIARFPDVNILYSDEDKMDAQGRRVDPHFKTDWNPDLLFSQNYISHLGVYRRSLIEQVGGFREGFEGSQDHDLVLRCATACQGRGIVHIPLVLYHWRISAGSTALEAHEKNYTTDAGIAAVSDSLGEAASVSKGKYPNTYRVRWRLPEALPLVTLIMPTHNGMEITRRAIDSILEKTDYRNFEIVVVDNNSDEPETLAYFQQIAQHGQIRVVTYPFPFNYSAINNMAVQHARGSVVGFVNNDIEIISHGWLSEMVSHALRPQIGCVGAKLYYPDGRLQHAGVILGIGGIAGHSHKYLDGNLPGYFSRVHLTQNISAVTAACMVMRKSIFDEVGGFDEAGLAVAFNDVDLCLRVREAGYRNVWTPYAELFHHESVSRGPEDSPEKRARFLREVDCMQKRWGDALRRDPYYNRNLTLEHENFTLQSIEDRFNGD